jgi:hypothetical protein
LEGDFGGSTADGHRGLGGSYADAELGALGYRQVYWYRGGREASYVLTDLP